MAHRPDTRPEPERARCPESREVASARLLRIDINRPKRIDGYIDYFGDSGARRRGGAATLGQGPIGRRGHRG